MPVEIRTAASAVNSGVFLAVIARFLVDVSKPHSAARREMLGGKRPLAAAVQAHVQGGFRKASAARDACLSSYIRAQEMACAKE
jgi:hypothetical protein